MTADILRFDAASEQYRLDREAFKLKVKGKTTREIAEEQQRSMGEVNASLARMVGGVTPNLRAEAVVLDMTRLDELNAAYYQRAIDGDIEAGHFILRLQERRARLLGLDAPLRSDRPLDEVTETETSTERITRLLDVLAGKKDQTIDGEIIDGEGQGSDNGTSDTEGNSGGDDPDGEL